MNALYHIILTLLVIPTPEKMVASYLFFAFWLHAVPLFAVPSAHRFPKFIAYEIDRTVLPSRKLNSNISVPMN